MKQPKPTEHSIQITDEKAISMYEYRKTEEIKGVILFTSAMATKQWYYRHLAQYLAKQGYPTYTMDYSGIGLSKEEESLRGSDITIRDWVEEVEKVVDWIGLRHEDVPMYYMCHSLGGQLFGLLRNASKFETMISITSQNGYWRLYKKPVGYFFFWYLVVPTLMALFGYFPSKRVGFGENLPKKVMKRWKKWCTSEDYFFDDETMDDLTSRYDNYSRSILTLSFTDDPWATHEAVESMVRHYTSAEIEHRHIEPEDVGLDEIGHLGYFRPKSMKLWKDLITWIEDH